MQGGSPFFDTFFVLVDVITTIIENVELDLLKECVSIYELIELFQKLSCFLAKLPPVFFSKDSIKKCVPYLVSKFRLENNIQRRCGTATDTMIQQ